MAQAALAEQLVAVRSRASIQAPFCSLPRTLAHRLSTTLLLTLTASSSVDRRTPAIPVMFAQAARESDMHLYRDRDLQTVMSDYRLGGSIEAAASTAIDQ